MHSEHLTIQKLIQQLSYSDTFINLNRVFATDLRVRVSHCC